MIRRILALLAALLFAGPALAQFDTVAPFGIPYGTSIVDNRLSQHTNSIFLGIDAGAAYPKGSSPGYGSVGIGAGALQSLIGTNLENVALGVWACQYVTTGFGDTCVGMHTLGADTTSNNNTAIGNDVARNAITQGGGITGVGQGVFHDGNPGGGLTGLGTLAFYGNATSVIVGGTKTTGNTLSITLAASGTTPGSVTGLPFTATHNVVVGDSLSTISADLASKINAAGISGLSAGLSAQSVDLADGTSAVSISFPGNATTGWAITTTVNVNGGTETLTVQTGAAPRNSIAIGNFSQQALAMGSPSANVTLGDATGRSIVSCNSDVLIGYNTGSSLTTCANQGFNGQNVWAGTSIAIGATTASNNTGVGHQTQANLTTGFSNATLGGGSGSKLTTGFRNLLLGTGVAATTLTTGNGNVLLASGARTVDTPASNTSNRLNIDTAIIGNIATPTVSSGFGSSPSISGASTAGFTVNVGTGGVATSGVVDMGTAAPTGWACVAVDGTNPDTASTVALPTSATTITLKNYSRTTGAVTAWAASDVVSVHCNGY